jgi:hypothetical protein
LIAIRIFLDCPLIRPGSEPTVHIQKAAADRRFARPPLFGGDQALLKPIVAGGG